MKMIILAAGQGKRLRPLTNDKPKCMVEYQDKPIIDYILESTNEISNKYILCGYKCAILKDYLAEQNLVFIQNYKYERTNMVYSLLCAKEIFDDDIIVSYSDIIYPKSFINALVSVKSDISVVADKNWYELWSKRFDNVLEDCETFKYDNNMNLLEIGNKSNKIEDTMAGYVGIVKFSKKVLNHIANLEIDYNIYMTDLLGILLEKYVIKVVLVEGPWLEVDNINDLEINI